MAFAADARYAAWARDLVCLAIHTGGQFTDAEKELIWEECETGQTTLSQTVPTGVGSAIPKVELLKLTHHQGVNTLADNQFIEFCNEGITMLYGQNRSGKSGYFRLLNQLATGKITYDVLGDVFKTPAPMSVTLEYKLNGVNQSPFTWDGVAPCPQELRHVRCFDSRYASHYLEKRDGNTYLFESYNLLIYRVINETVRFLKEDLHVTVDAVTDAALSSMCSIAYRDMVKQSLIDAFRDELDKLGMHHLRVDLEVDDLLSYSSKIAIRLTNNTAIDKVLSEAELKCCALALFLSECNLMEVQQPIIFDDPVNSLDASIIQAFTNRLKELPNEIIVFTHNVLFMEALTDERQFKVFDDPSMDRTKATTSKKHVLAYDVLTNLDKTGFVLGRKNKKTKFYLDSANAKLITRGPVTDVKSIADDLRMAVEWAIDEVIFRGLPTRRFKGSELTDWTTMEAMASAGVDIVRDLKHNYDQLSGMGLHVGTSSYVAPPSPSTLQLIHDDIERIYRMVYP